MNKRLFLLLLIFPVFVGVVSAAPVRSATEIVKTFSEHLDRWSNPVGFYDAEYSPRAEIRELFSTSPDFRIDTEQMSTLARKYNIPPSKTYDEKVFDDIFVEAIGNGTDISISDIRYVPQSERDPRYSKYETVACVFNVSGINNKAETCAFVMSEKGKILKITPYKVQIDHKTGRRRMKIDMSDVLDNLDVEYSTGIGGTFNFSKAFPVGASLYMSYSYFIADLNVGLNFWPDRVKPYNVDRTNFINEQNYKRETGVYHPRSYVTLTPGVYLKYVSVGYGCGIVGLNGETKKISVEPNNQGGYTYGEVTSTDTKNMFIMRPLVRGYIPCSEKVHISLSVAYNWVPKYKALNGFDFGIGINYILED